MFGKNHGYERNSGVIMSSTCSCTDPKLCPYVHRLQAAEEEEEDSDEMTSNNSHKQPTIASESSKYQFLKTKHREHKAKEVWKGQADDTSSSALSQTEDEFDDEVDGEEPTTETTTSELKKQLKKLQKQLHYRNKQLQPSSSQNMLLPRAGHRPSMHYVAARQRQTRIEERSPQSLDLTDKYRMKPKLSVHQRCNQWLETQKTSDEESSDNDDVPTPQQPQQKQSPQRQEQVKKHRYCELIQPISSESSPQLKPSKRVDSAHHHRNRLEHQEQQQKKREKVEECLKYDQPHASRNRTRYGGQDQDSKPRQIQKKRRKTTTAQPSPTAHNYESELDADDGAHEEDCEKCKELLHYQNKVKELQEHRHHRPGHFISKKRKPVTSSWVVLQAVNMLERTNTACSTLIHRTIQCELEKPDFTIEEVKETLKWMAKNNILGAKRDSNGIKMYTTKQVARGPNKRKMKAARSVFHAEGHLQRFEFPPIPSYEQVYGSDDSTL